MIKDRISDISMSRLVELVSQLPASVLLQLEDVLVESIGLEHERCRHDITPEEKQEVQQKIDELVRERDRLILGG